MGIFDFLKSNMSTSKKDKTQKKDIKDLLRIYVEDDDIKIDMSTKECGDWGIDYIEHENNIVNYKGTPFTGIVYDLFESDGKKEVWKEIDMKDGRKHGEYRNYSHGKLDWTQEYINGEQVSNGEIGGRIFHMTLEESRELDKSSDNPIYRHEESENTNNLDEDNSSIYSNEMINDVIDEKGYVRHDLWIQGEEVTSLGKLKKVYGDLNIYSNSLLDLGELNYVKGHVWVKSNSLSSLGNLERVGKDISLKNSSVISLGSLFRVGGKLNLRDTDIDDLSNLKYVKTLFLPKRLEDLNIDFIETKKVRYWKDLREKESSIKNPLNDVGGNNLRYSVMVTDEKEEENEFDWIVVENSHEFNYWYSEHGFKLGTLEFPISTDPKNRYYVSEKKLKEQDDTFEFYKNQLTINPEFLNQFDDDDNIRKLRDRLIYDLIKKMKSGLIKINIFINQTIFYEKIFSNFKVYPKFEFLDIYKLLNLDNKIDGLLNKSTTKYLSYSKIHEMELRLKKRQFYGETIVSNESSLNDYIQKNIDEFYTFIDKKLDTIYEDKFSLFHSLFGNLSTVEEINSQFPSRFETKYDISYSHDKIMSLREEGIKYFKESIDTPLFQKYIKVLENFETENVTKTRRRRRWKNLNMKSLWLGYNVNPISYCNDNPEGNVFNFFIENILHETFNSIVFGLQNDFRVSKGIPKIGEGWVSETELYYLLKEILSKEEIVHHGKPKWLGRQHVDIWFPKHKIGIEYQGLQHDQPVEFFGGEEGFIEGQKRDKRKKKLFKENNSILIEVREGYNIEDVVNEIKKNIT